MDAGRKDDSGRSGAAPLGPGVPPPKVVASARAAFRSRDVEALLAQLVTDSLDDPEAEPSPREITFLGGGLQIAVSVVGAPGQEYDVLIRLTPEDADSVEVQSHGQMPARAQCLRAGQWAASPVSPGPARVTVAHRGRTIRTAWTRL